MAMVGPFDDLQSRAEPVFESLPQVEAGFPAQVIGTGPTVRYSAMPEVFENLIYAAQGSLFITTPYYVPDEAMQAALCASARRGVETTLIFPARNDSWEVSAATRSYYADLLAAGVRIHEYEGGLLHAKILTFDGKMTLIGSANMDRRSFDLNYENNILFHDPGLMADIRARQEEFLTRSRRVTEEMVNEWSVWERFRNNAGGSARPGAVAVSAKQLARFRKIKMTNPPRRIYRPGFTLVRRLLNGVSPWAVGSQSASLTSATSGGVGARSLILSHSMVQRRGRGMGNKSKAALVLPGEDAGSGVFSKSSMKLQKACVTTIRPLATGDWGAVLRLNAENRPAVAALDRTELAHLLSFDGSHRVAVDEKGEVVGYLLSFPHNSGYDDTEFCWFRQHLVGPFFYICQVVVAQEHRQQQIGHAFYQDLLNNARQRGAQTLCCDVNTDPPNVGSFAFHHGLGFGEIGFGHASDGTAIAFLARII